VNELIVVVILAWASLCWLIERRHERMYRELRRCNATLESCRVLLMHIAENMQRGERVDLTRMFMKESMRDAIEAGLAEMDADAKATDSTDQ